LNQIGRNFKLEDLVKILNVYNSDKLNVLYNKFCYGFEKEGKCGVFNEKATVGAYF
jgi:hypothetical protein